MLIEPTRDFEVTIKLPMIGDTKYIFSNNLKVSQMVQYLREKGMLSKPLRDYYVMHENTELDLDLPLHVYNIEEGVLPVLSSTFGLHIVDEYSNELYVTVNARTDTILDIKKKVRNNGKQTQEKHSFRDGGEYTIAKHVKVYENINQMRLYKQTGNMYEMLDDDWAIKDCGLENNTKLYLIYYDWDGSFESWTQSPLFHYPLHLGPQYPAKFYRSIKDPNKAMAGHLNHDSPIVAPIEGQELELDFVGKQCEGRTVLSVALRLQEQYDVPVRNIKIYNCRYKLCQLNEVFYLDEYSYYFVYFF